MKIYTGTGDGGKTSLFSGERINKSDARIDAYGDIDELNAIAGWVIANLPDHEESKKLLSQLTVIQSDLFQTGALLATVPGSPAAESLSPITENHSRRLEEQIDGMDKALEPLNCFIVPGGHPAAASAHVARTVCRRAERRVVNLASSRMDIPRGFEEMLVYLNRLSDYFFVLARYCNHLSGVADIPWRG
jgi:cob(I)alamin adenosyltransferase